MVEGVATLIILFLLVLIFAFAGLWERIENRKLDKRLNAIKQGMLKDYSFMLQRDFKSLRIWKMFFDKWDKVAKVELSYDSEQYNEYREFREIIRDELESKININIYLSSI